MRLRLGGLNKECKQTALNVKKVNHVADWLTEKYNGLLHHNDYLARVCALVAQSNDINTELLV